eukprot:COSAG04_NODE_562_length_12576_cov_154.338703_3_plen_481_part_00
MPLTYLCVSAALSRPIRCCDGALSPSARVPTGRRIEDSYVFGDTAALSVTGCSAPPCLRFTPCSDLGGCGSGTLVASPATHAGRTQAVCCGTGMCADNPEEESWAQIPDRYCATPTETTQIASFPTEAEARAACLADASCRAVFDYGCDGSGEFWTCSSTGLSSSHGSCMYDHGTLQQPDFPCLAGSPISTGSMTAGYDTTTCCDATCAQNDIGPDFPCAAGSPIPTASSTAGYDMASCCEGFTCAQNDIGPDFPCSAPTHIKPAADQIVAYSQEGCCEVFCAQNDIAPDFTCSHGSLVSSSASTAGYDDETCCETFCSQNDVGADFACSEPTHLKPAASQIVADSQEECCDPDLCGGNANAADDYVCALGSLTLSASSTAGKDDLACCECSNVDESCTRSWRQRAILLAFKQSGNGAGLDSWSAGGEPCGAGSIDSYGRWMPEWAGVYCDAAGGSVERMCAAQPFPACVLHRLSALTSC